MASFTVARSIFRSSAARNAAARLASQSKSKPKASTFSLNSTANKPILRRSPVEMSFAVESMMPYHTVTASALMTSMLSISRCGYGWLPEDFKFIVTKETEPCRAQYQKLAGENVNE